MTLYGKKALIENIEYIKNVEIGSTRLDVVKLLKENNIPFVIKPDSYFNKFSNVNHQKIISYTKQSENKLELKDFLNEQDEKSLIVVLDSIMDPGNFGAILRSCEAFGVNAVIYKKDNQAQINETVSKTSQGAVNRINLYRVANLSQTLELLKDNGY
jgi:23S rRNA (guanosine2251-2'-O)-methyltransferase